MFELGAQKIVSWVYFSVILGVVLFILEKAWLDGSPSGLGLGKAFIDSVSGLSDSPEVLFFLFFNFRLILGWWVPVI